MPGLWGRSPAGGMWDDTTHECFSPSLPLSLLPSLKINERERNTDMKEKHWSVASCTAPTGDWTCYLGMCPDREFNRLPFGSWVDAQHTNSRRSGLCQFIAVISLLHSQALPSSPGVPSFPIPISVLIYGWTLTSWNSRLNFCTCVHMHYTCSINFLCSLFSLVPVICASLCTQGHQWSMLPNLMALLRLHLVRWLIPLNSFPHSSLLPPSCPHHLNFLSLCFEFIPSESLVCLPTHPTHASISRNLYPSHFILWSFPCQ